MRCGAIRKHTRRTRIQTSRRLPEMVDGNRCLVEHATSMGRIAKGVLLRYLQRFVAAVVVPGRATRHKHAPRTSYPHLNIRTQIRGASSTSQSAARL